MYPQLRLTGDAFTRGRQYGELGADRIRRSIQAYGEVFAHYASWDWSRVSVEAAKFIEPIETFGPKYLTEMRGIAEGAKVAFLDVLAINVRTEIMFAARARDAAVRTPTPGECTAFAAVPLDDRAVLTGQNWDWQVHSYETTVVLEVDPDDGPRYVTVVEAGLLAKAGFNEHGLGIVTNALVCDDDRGEPGVPYHVLLRAMLDATNASEALTVLQRADRSSSASYLISSKDGLALGVEATPGDFTRLFVTTPDARGIVLHTNHFLHPRFDRRDIGTWVFPDSPFRYQRADRNLSQSDPFASSTYERLFADHAGHPDGVCCHPRPAVIEQERGATIFSVVMNLRDLTMRLAAGLPCQTGYRTIDYADFFSG
jgi:isopenicillin-N N-acyltransferase-like protein